jgi:quercetin dioxygenase-like cupin family protein
MSLTDVAQDIKISPSMLSQLERGIVAPSLATVTLLATFYETRLFELFRETGESQGMLVRRKERTVFRLPGSNARYELISGVRQDLQLVEMTVDPIQETLDHTMSHPGEECVLVLSGRVRATLGTEHFDLESGDSLQYKAVIPHSYSARGRTARLIIAMTPPSF